jgi:hypothetical protein
LRLHWGDGSADQAGHACHRDNPANRLPFVYWIVVTQHSETFLPSGMFLTSLDQPAESIFRAGTGRAGLCALEIEAG